MGYSEKLIAFGPIIRFVEFGDTCDPPDSPIAHWRISSFSGNNGTCVEVAVLSNGHIAVRSSTRLQEGTILFTRAKMNAWIQGIKAGEFDDMTS
jgi:hypothetical protein